jgi:hypothetical protein
MIGAIAGIAGSVISAAGAASSANAQADQMAYNATVARINARSERQKGYTEQEKLGQRYDRLQSEQIVAASKGGIDNTYGSAALLIFGETPEKEYQDKSTAYQNAESAAIGNENKAKDLDAQAAATRKAGKISAASSLIGGVAGLGKSLMING